MSTDQTTERSARSGNDEQAGESKPRTARGARTELMRWVGPLLGLIGVLAVAAITTPQLFNGAGIRLILIQVGLIGVAAIGQTLVLLVAGIDLSVGSVIGITVVSVAIVSGGDDSRTFVAIVVAVLIGLAVGACNALLVAYRRVPPFVATFASFVVVQGVITAWTSGAPAGSIPGALAPLGSGSLLGLPVPVWVFASVAVVAGILLSRSTYGRKVYATGSSEPAARAAGINTQAVTASSYVVCALLAVLTGLIMAGYVGQVDSELTRSMNLDSIAAAVVGGVALSGGRGRISQTVIGVLILAVLLAWIIRLGAGVGGQLVVEGAAILLAVILQSPAVQSRVRNGGK